MRRDLFYIPNEIVGLPVFKVRLGEGEWGLGLVFFLFLILAVAFLVRQIRREGWNADTSSTLMLLVLIGAAIVIVLPHVVQPQGLPIRGYGLMVLIAILVSVYLAMYRARQVGADPDIIFSLAFWVFLAGIVGARGLYVVEYWDHFQSDSLWATLRKVASITEGGLVVYGGLIAASLAFAWFVVRNRLPALALADIAAASLALGQGIGRIGCLLNGCCFGGVCELPWAVTFPYESPPFVRQVEEGQLFLHGIKITQDESGAVIVSQVQPGSAAETEGSVREGDRIILPQESLTKQPATLSDVRRWLFSFDGSRGAERVILPTDGGQKTWPVEQPLPRSLRVHPTQVYSTINGLVVFYFLWSFFPYRQRDGAVVAMLLTVFPLTRFLMELIRTDEPAVLGVLTISQTISLALMALGAALWMAAYRKTAPPLMTPADWKKHNAAWTKRKEVRN